MKTVLLLTSVFIFSTLSYYAVAQEKVVISGYVTDYENNPLDSVTVGWKAANNNILVQALTNKDGYYKADVPKGRYYSMFAIDFSKYLHTSKLPEDDRRLEFWGWNFIADRDTTFNMKYDRMEVYGLNVFRVQNATPAYTIFFRPMSLTKSIEWLKNPTTEARMGPSPENADITVIFNDELLEINMIQDVKEYFDDSHYAMAYLLSVSLPKSKSSLPYDIIKIIIQDKENGDKGEGVYFLEKTEYAK